MINRFARPVIGVLILAVALTFITLATAAVNAWRSLTHNLPESVA